MKTIKQKFLHSKLNLFAVLFFALILLISGGFMTKKAKAEGTFSEANFAMCEGAEVRTDGKNGIRFIAGLGDVLPTETDYANLTYNVMIVPQAYISYYGITDNYYTALKSALEADSNVKNKFIATMQAQPFYSDEVVEGEEGYYVRGTLSNVQYENINIDWFGMAYLTYTDSQGATQYVYAQIPESGANVRSLVYCASGYLNVYDYSSADKAQEKEILTNFVAQGINQKSGVAKENKDDKTYLNEGLQAFEASASQKVNLLPNSTAKWETGVPAGVNMHVIYAAEDETYASIDENGVITGVAGDGNAQTTKYVTMTAFGKTYQKPVHVYAVTANVSSDTAEIFSKNGVIGDTTFCNSAQLTTTAQVDGEDVEENLSWNTTNTQVATVADGIVTAVENNAWFTSEDVNVSFSFDFEGETITSNECTVKVSFPIAYKTAPIAYGDLLQNEFNSNSTALVAITQDVNTDVLGDGFGTVTNFLSDDLTKELLVDGKTDANVYTAKQAGEKMFVVVAENGYAYTVKATVVNYAISNATELTYFLKSYASSEATGDTNPSYGTYTILSTKITDYVIPSGTASKSNTAVYCGTFDGRGYTIDLAEKNGTKTNAVYRGFFGKTLSGPAMIKNTAFIGLVGTSAGGGLIHTVNSSTTTSKVVVDNCYIDVSLNMGGSAGGGVCYNAGGKTISNVVVNASASTTTTTSNKGTISNSGGGNIKNCYSIGKESKVIYTTGTSKTNVYFSNNELLAKVISDNKPISGFNEYWKSTTEGLMFGDNLVLTYTTTTA